MTSLHSHWAELGGLMLTARRLVDGLYAGHHQAHRTGDGVDFYDYRAYAPGDDLADLDWKLLGRSDRLYIKRYRQQTDMPVYLLLDASASMGFRGMDAQGQALLAGSGHPSKYQVGCLLTAALAYLAIRQSDRVGLGIFTDKLVSHLPPMGSPQYLQQLVAVLEQSAPAPGQGSLRTGLDQLERLIGRRSLIIVVSDMLDAPAEFFTGIAPLRQRGHQAMVLQILTPEERQLSLPDGLALQWVDMETSLSIQAQSGAIKLQYTRLMDEHLQTLRNGCLSHGIDHQLILTPQNPMEALRAFLTVRAKR